MNARSRDKVWIVRPGDGATVAEILRKAREAPDAAVRDGRVFIGRRRVLRVDEPVRPGDEVKIGRAHAPRADVDVLLVKDGLVACVKPAGIPTVPDQGGASHALVDLAARAVGLRREDLRVTSRLDRDVSGVVVFASSAEAEARLRRAREEGTYERRYVAIARSPHEASLPDVGRWDAPIGDGADPKHRSARGPSGKDSLTHFRVAARAGEFVLLGVAPVTGRTHQIRVHASDAGAPLFGDRAYGGPARMTLPSGGVIELSRVALHAARVRVDGVDLRAPIPSELTKLWTSLGGAADAWELATTCAIDVHNRRG